MIFPFLSQALVLVNPGLGVLENEFGINAYNISSLPNIFVFIGTMVAGAITGKFLKYRTAAILSSLIYIVSGCLPALLNDLMPILVCRAILGFGIGLLKPFANALVIGLYPEKRRANLLGIVIFASYGAGVLFQLFGGLLAENFSWRAMFWSHAVGVIGLIAAFFLPEPAGTFKKEEKEKGKGLAGIGMVVWLCALFQLLMNMLCLPVFMQVAALFTDRNLGGPAAAGIALSFMDAGFCVGGLLYGRIFKSMKKWLMPVFYVTSAIGMFLLLNSQHIAVFVIGLLFTAVSAANIFPAHYQWMGQKTPKFAVLLASSMIAGIGSLGSFIATPYMNVLKAIFGETRTSAMVVVIVGYFLFAVIFAIIRPFKDADAVQQA
jgi:MFS family permease